ncbi:hypothetical protein EG328_008557 [Venturia inaequalis]|uniref:Uncharacterized protein n=1 Tax=Venturia inaequalis TaxID=5025 RepID=A0A8H3VDT4_VENIN|nr:hypothetical protein EG328_008557 [Venturia inaequalis]KAE9988127.1 hypothetical protein EG327_003486 [Venturia inaequalis]RDI88608.1 hypothetical protein Vi05172_g1269 [Venturia inaequalis]
MAGLASQIEALFHLHFCQRRPPPTPISKRAFKFWCETNARKNIIRDCIRDPSTAEDSFERQILHCMALERGEKWGDGLVSLKRFYDLPNELKLQILELTLTEDEIKGELATRTYTISPYGNHRPKPISDAQLLDFRFDGNRPGSDARQWYEQIRKVSGLRPVAETMKGMWSIWIDEWIHEFAYEGFFSSDCPIGSCTEHTAAWIKAWRALWLPRLKLQFAERRGRG